MLVQKKDIGRKNNEIQIICGLDEYNTKLISSFWKHGYATW